MVDGVIVLYDQNETSFTTNGLGYLPDSTECIVTEELNGEFELQMEYPINGLRYKEIQHRRILLVKTNPYEDPQPFRIYNINKPIDGLVEINARHISYDLSGYALPWIDDCEGRKSDLPFATGPASFMANFPNLVNQLNSDMPQFTYWTNSTEDWPRNPSGGSEAEKENELKEPHWIFVDQPMNARNLIGQFTEKYKGEFKWDKFNVQFYGPISGQSEDDTRYRGKDSGVVLRYGKNLTDLMQEEDSDKGMYTHIYPYWSGSIEYTKPNGEKGNKETVIELPDKLYPVFNDHTPDYKRIYVYDCTSDYTAELQSKDGQKYPSEETLREMCDKLIKNNKLGTPNITLTASFVQLSKSVEYKDLALLEKILLGDTVTVYFPDLDVDSTLKCTSVEYNVLTDEYRTITLGEANTSVSNTIANTASMSSSNSTAIAGSATKNDVFGKSYDTALSTTSENAVQNKVVTGAFNSTNGRVKSLEDCCKSVKGEISTIIETIEGLGTGSITYGYSLPTGGNDGDVYLQIVDGSGDVLPSDMTGATWVGYTDNTCEYDPDTQRFEIASTGHWRYYNYSFGMVELDFDKIDTIYIKGTCVAESLSGNEGSWALVVGVGDKTPTQVAESDPTAIEGFGITALFDSYIMSWDDPDLQPGEYYLKTGEDFIFQFDVSAITGAHYLSIVTSRSTQVDISSIQFTADTPAQIVDIWMNNEGTWIKEEETSGIPAGGTTGQVLGKLSDTDYDLGWINQSGGGGSGATQELLYSGNSLSQSIQLSKSWTDFDALYILGEDDTSGSTFVFASTLFKDDLTTDYRIGISTDIGYIWYSITNNTMLSLIGAYTGYYIKSIRGIKFSGGGGGGGGSYTETTLYDAAWVPFEIGDTIILSDDASNYDAIVIYASYHELYDGDYYCNYGQAVINKYLVDKSITEAQISGAYRGDIAFDGMHVGGYTAGWTFCFTAPNIMRSKFKGITGWNNQSQCGIYRIAGIKY